MVLRKKDKKEYKEMKDRKIRLDSDAEKALSKEIRERLDLIDKEMNDKLEALGCLFAGSKDYPEQFHLLYVQPLLESGLTLQDSFALLVDGVLRPN
jgi:hypothetical protein